MKHLLCLAATLALSACLGGTSTSTGSFLECTQGGACQPTDSPDPSDLPPGACVDSDDNDNGVPDQPAATDDNDGDGQDNATDTDDDGDGVIDQADNDADGDGVPDSIDCDHGHDDGDGDGGSHEMGGGDDGGGDGSGSSV